MDYVRLEVMVKLKTNVLVRKSLILVEVTDWNVTDQGRI